MPSKVRELQAAKKYDLVYGSDSVNPFDPPRQMPCHAGSVALLLLSIQRRRREQQTAVEVGTFQAQMARWVLTCCPHLTLHCVDPWKKSEPGEAWHDRGDRFAKLPQEQLDLMHMLACEMADQFNAGLEKPRVLIHRKASLDAVNDFEDGSLDLAFLDGAHDKESVYADAIAWRTKVRPGGYLAFHDYRRGGNYFGLVGAVEKATAELGLTIEVWPGKVGACLIP
jgi:hypothetical protein